MSDEENIAVVDTNIVIDDNLLTIVFSHNRATITVVVNEFRKSMDSLKEAINLAGVLPEAIHDVLAAVLKEIADVGEMPGNVMVVNMTIGRHGADENLGGG